MKPDRDVEEVEEELVETQRQGSAAALLAGLLMAARRKRYFCYLFLACVLDRRPQPNVSTPAPRSDGRDWAA